MLVQVLTASDYSSDCAGVCAGAYVGDYAGACVGTCADTSVAVCAAVCAGAGAGAGVCACACAAVYRYEASSLKTDQKHNPTACLQQHLRRCTQQHTLLILLLHLRKSEDENPTLRTCLLLAPLLLDRVASLKHEKSAVTVVLAAATRQDSTHSQH